MCSVVFRKPSMSAGCAVGGCRGAVVDGYCDVCGSPAGVTASGSAGLASRGLGSRRAGSARSRPAVSSQRLRVRRLGAGLTTVPPVPVGDPVSAVVADPVVPERKRVCPGCQGLVGQGCDGVPGRAEGVCGRCGARFDFRPVLAAGDLVAGQYEVVGPLAHGGMGWIYLARDRNVSDRPVVLKGLLSSGDPDQVAAAIAERRFLAQVEHRSIVQIYNFVTHAGQGYIVMEYVGGKSLRQVLAERRRAAGQVDPLPVDQALAYLLEVLPVLGHLHERGLLYCDLKPANLMCQGDTVKLIDLGGVRRVDDEVSAVFGTVGYQAPEVPVDGPSVASDVFTVGRTLANLVLDFRGNTTTYATSLPPVSEHPVLARYDSFYRLLAKACADDPDDRFASMDELRVQMLGVLREVVATDRGGPARGTSTSLLFASLAVDGADRPLRAAELPLLRPDEHDPMYTWLAGITVDEPGRRFEVLSQAPQTTPEVLIAQAHAATARAYDQVTEAYGQAAEIFTKNQRRHIWSDRAQRAAGQLLDLDPWDWRAVWLSGLVELGQGQTLAARESFSTVYGQVPGELAPKLALATCCELSGETDLAESLYQVCAATDTTYTSPAAFGLARIRQRRGDTDGALAALDLVGPTLASHPQAQAMRARLAAGGDLTVVPAAAEPSTARPDAQQDVRTAAARQARRPRVVDRRKIDPQTSAVREPVAPTAQQDPPWGVRPPPRPARDGVHVPRAGASLPRPPRTTPARGTRTPYVAATGRQHPVLPPTWGSAPGLSAAATTERNSAADTTERNTAILFGAVFALLVIVLIAFSFFSSRGGDNTPSATGTADTLSRTLVGHQAPVNSVKFWELDGRTVLASASSDSTVRLWDVRDGQLIRVFEGHQGPVNAVVFGKGYGRTFVVSASSDSTVRLWDVRDGQLLRVFEGHQGPVRDVVLGELDGRTFLASAGDDGTVRLWNPEDGQQIGVLEGHQGSVYSLAFGKRDGQSILASGGADSTVRLWDVRDGQLLHTLECHQEVDSVEFLQIYGSTTVVSGSYDSTRRASNDETVRLWDPKDGQPIRTFRLQSVLSERPGHNRLAGSFDETVRVWDLQDGRLLRIFEGHQGPVNYVAFGEVDGWTVLASGSDDHTVRIWDLSAG